MYQFTEDCVIGIHQIDEEHRTLFRLINDAISLPEPERTADKVAEVLRELTEYAATHFAHEEAYMKQQQDPELSIQQKEHKQFVTYITALSKQPLSRENASERLEEVLRFLVRWLYHHILSSDMMIGKLADKEEGMFTFSSKYYTGIAMIDEEHKHLFEIIGEANDLIRNELLYDKYDEIVHLLEELKEYTETHFADEEAYMESIGYPELEMQKRAHAAFIDKLADIDYKELEEMDDNQQGYLLELIDFLAGWLIQHILKMDTKIGAYIPKEEEAT